MGVEKPQSQLVFFNYLVESLSGLANITFVRSRMTTEPFMRNLPDPYWSVAPLRFAKLHLDIIHYPNLGDGRSPPVLFSVLKPTVVVTLHGIATLSAYAERYLGTKKYLSRRFALGKSVLNYRLMAKLARVHIVCVSESARKEIIGHLEIPDETISVVHHGVDHTKFRLLENADVIKQRLKDTYGIDGPFVLHVSSCDPKKNISTLLRAFDSLRRSGKVRHRLVICGQTRAVARSIAGLNPDMTLDEEVIYLGHVPGADLPKLYNAADLFVFPSLYEGFGLPLLEAMACGCPVVGSNVYSVPEVTRDAAVLVDPLNAEELANTIHRVLSSESLRQELTQKGLERSKDFSWQKCAKQYVQIYEKVSRH